MDDLKTQAEELGIKVDGRWSEERLQQEIDKALDAPSEAKSETAKAALPVRLLRGYVPMSGKGKVPSGQTIELPADEARMVVASGIAVRADAF